MSKYVYRQLVDLLPHRVFDRIVEKYQGNRYVRSFTCWNQLLVMMFAQLIGCGSLRELILFCTAHKAKTKWLGFGDMVVTRSNLSKANQQRDYRIFEEFAYHLVSMAQSKRINRIFELKGKFYAFDSTTIDLCLSIFWWAAFRKTKGGIKVHTLFDIVTQIPTFFHITAANVHDVKAMDEIPYEQHAYYIFDKGYYDWARLYNISTLQAYFIIREKNNIQYEIIDGDEVLDGGDNILFDQRIRLTTYTAKKRYPGELRRIGFYSEEYHRTFVYLTNNWEISAKNVALLYKYRWQVELFFKWLKQHLQIKRFWGTSENAVRIQIYTAISAYCLVTIAEHDYGLDRSMFDVLRVVSNSLLDTMPIRELFGNLEADKTICDDTQQQIDFDC